MKKLLAAALAAMMMFAVVGCGKDEAPAEDANNEQTVEENAEAPAEDATKEDAEAPAEEATEENAEAPAEEDAEEAPAEEAKAE